MTNQRILLQIKVGSDSLSLLDEEDVQTELNNPDSEYFEWKWASFPVAELQTFTIVESKHSKDECVAIDAVGQATTIKITLLELHKQLNNAYLFKWN